MVVENQSLSKTYPTYRSLGRPILFLGFTGNELLILFGITVLFWLVVTPWFLVMPMLLYLLVGRPSSQAAKEGDYRYLSGVVLRLLLPSGAEDKDGFLKDL